MRPRLNITPLSARVDEQLTIVLEGLPASSRVAICARLRDQGGREWRSEGVFTADASGGVDLATQGPESGTYGGADSMGLLWSMETDPPAVAFTTSLDRALVYFTASVEGEVVATSALEWRAVDPGVSRVPVRDDGLIATLFLPASAPPHPVVITLGGSGGGLSESAAALFASHGIAGFALAYFGVEHLPKGLKHFPIEYFATALQWLRKRPDIRSGAIAVSGVSRGGELALLLGSMYPEIKAVLGWVPSGLVHGGFPRDGDGSFSAWSYQGADLPFVGVDDAAIGMGDTPIRYTPGFVAALRDVSAVEAATIPVERINGPVLLLSGADDQMWPSSLLSEIAMRRLRERGHDFKDEHISYEGAGHLISRPYLPCTTTRVFHPVLGIDLACGGSAAAYAHANADSWKRALDFLTQRFASLNAR